MVAGVAHEINNPVNFIHGNLHHAENYVEEILHLLDQYQYHCPKTSDSLAAALEEADLPFLKQDITALFHSMKAGAQRIREIVLSLRNFSRLDEAELKPVDLHEGLESTLMIFNHRLKPQSGADEIEIIRDYSDLPSVTCYARQINQVFMNVLANAIDALEAPRADGTPAQITISTTVESVSDDASVACVEAPVPPATQANWAVVTIADNGSGISPNVQARLFEPFFTTKPVGQGTGLID